MIDSTLDRSVDIKVTFSDFHHPSHEVVKGDG